MLQFAECDKKALRSLSLVEDEDSELAQPGSNLEEHENANEENEYVQQDEQQVFLRLGNSASEVRADALRHRQIAHLLHTRKKQKKEKREREDFWYNKGKEILISEGVSPETAELLPRDELEPEPAPLRNELLA